MSKEIIERLINANVTESGMIETAIKGIQMFKITGSIRCAPAVYEPSITAIIKGNKEAICNGERHFYDNRQYICCTMSMPIEAGTPEASQGNPLLGVYISLDTKLMTELVLEMQSTTGAISVSKGGKHLQGLSTAQWDHTFTEALYRILLLADKPNDLAILGKSRLRELYYAILKGESGDAFKRAFGVGNEVARSIEYLSSRISEPITIDDMADYSGMSRAVFHRKFKQATNMSPIQFVKSMRLNNAAMKISQGVNVNVAAMEVGYVSASQFSREFKRLYGISPKQWRKTKIPFENTMQ